MPITSSRTVATIRSRTIRYENRSSARSGDIFGNRQVLVVRTSEGRANPICQLVSREQTVELYNLALAMDPLGLHRIEPRALYGQQTAYDPHSMSTLFDPAVVGGYPLPDPAAYVPGGYADASSLAEVP